MNYDYLAEVETEVWLLREELVASQKVQAELSKGLINAIGGVDMAQERVMEQEA